MGFNLDTISKIVNIAKTIKNPTQAKNMILDKIAQKNPQMANMLRQAMQSGKNPVQVLKENITNHSTLSMHYAKLVRTKTNILCKK